VKIVEALHIPGRCRRDKYRSAGVTLTELLVVVAIIAIVAAVSLPTFRDSLHKARLKRAVEDIRGLIFQARVEGPIRDSNMSIVIDPAAWCLGFSAVPGCDCRIETGAGACVIEVAGEQITQRVSGAAFPGVAITSSFPGNTTTINRLRGTLSPAGKITVVSGAWKVDVRVSLYGRLRVCTPEDAGPIAGYGRC